MYTVDDGKFKLEHGSVNEGFIAVASGKGGVGKSTVTVNLAQALTKLGKKVGIIDADIHGFSVTRIAGLKDKPRGKSEDEIIPPEINGIKIMSMGSLVEENRAIIWRAPLLLSTLQQFMKEVHWGELDYLLFDLPPGTGDMSLNIMQNLPDAGILVVTTPQATAANVAVRIGKMAEQLNCDLLGIVENMSYYKCSECGNKEYIFGQGGGEKMAEELNTDLLAQLPLVSEVREGSDKGRSIILDNPEAEVAKKFMDTAEAIIKKD